MGAMNFMEFLVLVRWVFLSRAGAWCMVVLWGFVFMGTLLLNHFKPGMLTVGSAALLYCAYRTLRGKP